VYRFEVNATTSDGDVWNHVDAQRFVEFSVPLPILSLIPLARHPEKYRVITKSTPLCFGITTTTTVTNACAYVCAYV
jgi:hypothetical protein